VRVGLIRALEAYTAIWKKGCTPPGSVNWKNPDNNKAFLAQSVVMTPNTSLSIPAALKRLRPDDYLQNAATVDWPHAVNGQPMVLLGGVLLAVVFKEGGHVDTAKEFVRFLAEKGWLAHWLTFAGDRYLPPMRKLVEQPFWLNPSDPHRMFAAIQIMTRPHLIDIGVRDHEWQSDRVTDENVWGNAVHRVAADGISPAQAVDEGRSPGSTSSWGSSPRGPERAPKARADPWVDRAEAQAFSSRLSSFRKRQSVPSARIAFGVDLIMPTSRSRSA
jgi:multiple sugar transport system substrate-binding protein